jgi:CBS domain-containing protein
VITVKQLLQNKMSGVWTISPQATVYQALELMADKNVGALPVVENDKLVGMFSERDYARKVILCGRTSRESLVGELMTSTVFFVRPTQGLEDCLALMTERHIRHLPVMEGDQLVGIVTIGDVGKAIIAEQKIAIRDLENYIVGVWQR